VISPNPFKFLDIFILKKDYKSFKKSYFRNNILFKREKAPSWHLIGGIDRLIVQ